MDTVLCLVVNTKLWAPACNGVACVGRDLVGLGVPKLRALFLETFGHHTASNNGSWLRRKLCEKPDMERGRGRSAAVRKRDQGAAIWTTGTVRNITQVRLCALVFGHVSTAILRSHSACNSARKVGKCEQSR